MLDSRRRYVILYRYIMKCHYCMSMNWVCLPLANTRPRQTVCLTGKDRKRLQLFRVAMRSVDKEMNAPAKRLRKVNSWELLEGHHEIEAKDSQGHRRKKTVRSLSGLPIFGALPSPLLLFAPKVVLIFSPARWGPLDPLDVFSACTSAPPLPLLYASTRLPTLRRSARARSQSVCGSPDQNTIAISQAFWACRTWTQNICQQSVRVLYVR